MEAAVVGRTDPAWGEVPVAAVVRRPGGGVDALMEWARGRLAGFKVPAIHCLRVAMGVEEGTNQVQRIVISKQVLK